MISIIICSRKPIISTSLSQNIGKTIGCAYEIIVIDNSENKYSIFEAYNLGIQKSKGIFWCFIHDDIFIHTNNWGLELIKIFESDSKIGLIGVAGAKIKTKMPSGWWDCPMDYKTINILQHFNAKDKKLISLGWEDNIQIKKVAVIDGVFMFAKKHNSIYFDDSISGFHCYDYYLSMLYNNLNFKVVVTKSLLLEHFSLGNFDENWLNFNYLFHIKYKNSLPINKTAIKNIELRKIELYNGKRFIEKLFDHKKYNQLFVIWFYLVKLKPISLYHFILTKKLLKVFLNKL
jgi:hypothetical protein